MTTIYLVRHGNTDYTGNRLAGYIPGIHLNKKGQIQAENTADFLQTKPIKAIFSSPLERTMETAIALAVKLDLPVVPLEFLKEINFGGLQGLGEELDALPVWHQFLTHPAAVMFPKGESIRAAQQRVVEGLNELSTKFSTEDEVVCFSHCEILRLAVAYALHIPLDDYMRLTIAPASISSLVWQKDMQTLTLLNYVPEIELNL
jgi:broad specificity phosphatase PhoE